MFKRLSIENSRIFKQGSLCIPQKMTYNISTRKEGPKEELRIERQDSKGLAEKQADDREKTNQNHCRT